MDRAEERRQFLLGSLLLLCVATVATELRRYQLDVEIREAWQSQSWLTGRNVGLQLERSAERIAQLSDAVKAFSNKCAAVKAQYDEELATHEPLRRQIEQMMQESIEQKAALAKKAESLTALTKKREAEAADHGALAEKLKSAEAAATKAKAAEAEAKTAEADAKAVATEAKAAAAELRKQLDEAREKLKAAQVQLEERQ